MSPFTKIQNLFNAIITDVTSLFYTVMFLGILFCAFMLWRGSEENHPRFQKGIAGCFIAIIVVAVGKIAITWIRTKLA